MSVTGPAEITIRHRHGAAGISVSALLCAKWRHTPYKRWEGAMARRKKTSPLEDVLDLLAMLPWWACVMLAAVSYLLLHRLAAPIQASDLQGQGGAMVSAMMQKAVIHGMATAGQYIVPLLCLAAAGLSALRRKQRQSLLADVAQAPNAAALDGMSWREFELLVGEAYRLQGYRVTELGGEGPDGGVDLVLTKGGEKFFVQCKQWKAYKVGSDHCARTVWRHGGQGGDGRLRCHIGTLHRGCQRVRARAQHSAD